MVMVNAAVILLLKSIHKYLLSVGARQKYVDK